MSNPVFSANFDPTPADLTLLVRRDGVILNYLVGTGGTIPEDAKPGKTLVDLWNVPVADDVCKQMARCLKGRGEVAHRFLYHGEQYEITMHRQSADRVVLAVRTVTQEPRGATPDRALSAPQSVGALPGVSSEEFQGRLSEVVVKARLHESRFALAIIHLGGLSEFESAFGPSLGEKVIASAIERVLGAEPRACCARLEDNLLAVLLEGMPGHDAAGRAAEGIRRALVKDVTLGGRTCVPQPTIGVAMYPGDGRDSQTLLDSARTLTQEVEQSGRTNTVVFCSDTLPVRALSRPDLERELRWAIEGEQFELQYLPIIELAGRRTEGLEAVVRWTHPVAGHIPPEQFQPMLEGIEMQVALDRWALAKACRDLAELTRRGNTRQRLAVRLSRQFITDDAMATHIDAALSGASITPSRLALDIDMRALLGGARVRDRLRELRKRGIRVFLDQFGPDGAPLARLARLPIDGLKINRAFVARIEHDASARAVCSAIVAIARAFGLQSLGPGVETRAQLDFLFESKCDLAQGPLFCTPQSVAELPDTH